MTTISKGRGTKFVRAAGRMPRRGFTLLELLVVIAIIGILAGFVVGLAPVANARMREGRLKGQLEDLVSAVEEYKAQKGVYPPDNYDAVNRVTISELNPLYHELTGLFVDNSSDKPHFVTPEGSDFIYSAQTEHFFHREGFVNAVPLGKRRTFVHQIPGTMHARIFRSTTDAGYAPIEVLAVGYIADATPNKKGAGFWWPTDAATTAVFPTPIPSNPGLNPWHYVSTNPTNNPGGFDLWAEVIVNGEKKIFGNWKQ
jgi:prepilin-type N-terminal cleavage/methylation domain-containing protein